jgi:hypothetical protein
MANDMLAFREPKSIRLFYLCAAFFLGGVFFVAGPSIRETPPGNDIVSLSAMATYRF